MPGLLHATANQTQQVIQSLAAVTSTTTATGVEITDYEGQVALLVLAPSITGTPSVVFTLEHSDVLGSGYVAVSTAAGAVASPAWTTGAIGNAYRVLLDTDALKRYVRTVCTVTGGTTPTVSGSVLITGVKKVQ